MINEKINMSVGVHFPRVMSNGSKFEEALQLTPRRHPRVKKPRKGVT